MKKYILSLTTAFFVLSTFSCSGDSEDNNTIIYHEIDEATEKYERSFREVCDLYGLNRADYDTCYFFKKDDKNLNICVKKKVNTIFVGLYDESTKNIILKNDQVSINPVEYVQYYENKYACTIYQVNYEFVETDKGFVCLLNLDYRNEDLSIAKVYSGLEIIYFNDGNKTIPKKMDLHEGRCQSHLIKWYSNSCIFLNDPIVTCYTDDGKEVFILDDRESMSLQTNELGNSNVFFLSYTDILYINYNVYVHELDVYRKDLLKKERDWINWETRKKILEDLPESTRVSIDVEKGSPLWKITINAVTKDGTKKSAVVSLNIDTGEIKEL